MLLAIERPCNERFGQDLINNVWPRRGAHGMMVGRILPYPMNILWSIPNGVPAIGTIAVPSPYCFLICSSYKPIGASSKRKREKGKGRKERDGAVLIVWGFIRATLGKVHVSSHILEELRLSPSSR